MHEHNKARLQHAGNMQARGPDVALVGVASHHCTPDETLQPVVSTSHTLRQTYGFSSSQPIMAPHLPSKIAADICV